MKTRRIGPFSVSALGLGCMNLSHAYGTPPPREVAAALLRGALDAGITLFDTAALYAFGAASSWSSIRPRGPARRADRSHRVAAAP
ncbi:MAG: aldo/keto reductase [Burkholderiaceae bacterium]|nr:aldo/keto reductase [Roseateles sp.]MBV8468670.1 aldo/keto reductase [Burkholderiaceae bacterium]